MSKYARFYLAIIIAIFAVSEAAAQDTFRNPALESGEEWQRVFDQGRVLARNGDPEGAIKEFEKAAKLRNDQCAECFQMMGQVYFQMASYKNAADAFRQAVALKPKNEAALDNALGASLFLLDDKKSLPEAESALKRAIELDSKGMPTAYYNLGHVLIKLGRNDEAIAVLKQFLELDPSSSKANQARAMIANPAMAGANFAPTFSVKSSEGKELSLEKLKGKIVLLDFWASWCGPCRQEMPEVKKIWTKYGGDRFVIIGVNLDRTVEAFESYVTEEGLTWPQYYDAGGRSARIAQLYNVPGIPHTVLIDQDGIIRAVGLRGGSLSNRIGDLMKKLEK